MILEQYSALNQYFYFDVKKKKSQILTVAIPNSYIVVKNDMIMNKKL